MLDLTGFFCLSASIRLLNEASWSSCRVCSFTFPVVRSVLARRLGVSVLLLLGVLALFGVFERSVFNFDGVFEAEEDFDGVFDFEGVLDGVFGNVLEGVLKDALLVIFLLFVITSDWIRHFFLGVHSLGEKSSSSLSSLLLFRGEAATCEDASKVRDLLTFGVRLGLTLPHTIFFPEREVT